jgi:prepilin-type N-terminal cleavage/methylation domain-containing protein
LPIRPTERGLTLPELITALSMLAVLAALTLPTFDVLARLSLDRSADLAAAHLSRARLEALARRQKVEVRLAGGGRLLLVDASGTRVSEVDLAGEDLLAVDSARIRPSSIRYNARGQGSPGSLYLYRGRRGVRVISNFVGRVRRQGFRF